VSTPPGPSRASGRSGRALAVATVGLVVFLAPLLAVTSADAFVPLDRHLARLARGLSETVVAVVGVVTILGALPTVAAAVIVVAVALARARHRRAALGLVLGFVGIVIAVHFLKAGVGRLRPPGADPSLTTASFPSGHAAYATAYTAIGLALVGATEESMRRRRTIVGVGILLTIVIGLTRVVLGVHYLSDVVAGWGLGAAIFGLTAALLVLVGAMRHTGERAPSPAERPPARP
jgi:membrane-associated phospholipid phosphatase